MSVQDAKKELRKAMVARRASISLPARQTANHAITEQVLRLGGFHDAQTVLAYMSFGAEFNTTAFVRASLERDKVTILPKINAVEQRLDLYRVCDLNADFVSGTWGILEPNPLRCAKIATEEIDFVLVPGVAFDSECNRLGYGGGYYDRLLDDLGPFATLVGPAFAVQIVERVPIETHDISLDLVITEERKYARNDFLNQER
jgi:5-formyltetrahydrofolate cyclo-ligase